MTNAAPDPERLLDEAIDLTIRLQSDPANSVTLEMVSAWRARSPEHERIWQRVADAHGASGKVLSSQRKAARRQNLGLTRRNLIVGGAVGLGAAAAGVTFGPDLVSWAEADHITPKGEIRGFALIDGSKVTLGPDSALALAYEETRRRIRLLKGLAFFDVARDTRRPFVVEAGRLTITAVGTAFDVADDAGIISIGVESGSIEAQASGLRLASAGRLASGDWISVDAASQDIERGKRETGQIAAWRDNMIMAEKETVSALVARIARWHEGRVVLAAPNLGAERVSGVFDLRNPHRALEAVVHPAGGRVRRVSSFLTLITPL
jgi:transmembrane sensor